MIARSVRLHEEITREERAGGGGGSGGRAFGEGRGEGGSRDGELSDSVVARIVRDVQQEMGRLEGVTDGSGTRSGRRVLVRRRSESVVVIDGAGVADEVRDREGSAIQEPPPAYKPRD